MKPITWIRLFLFCVVVGSFRVVEARDVRSMLQEKTDTLINPPLMKQGEQILRFDKTVLNIGTMTEDDAPKIYHFTYTNVSDKTINLIHVSNLPYPQMITLSYLFWIIFPALTLHLPLKNTSW